MSYSCGCYWARLVFPVRPIHISCAFNSRRLKPPPPSSVRTHCDAHIRPSTIHRDTTLVDPCHGGKQFTGGRLAAAQGSCFTDETSSQAADLGFRCVGFGCWVYCGDGVGDWEDSTAVVGGKRGSTTAKCTHRICFFVFISCCHLFHVYSCWCMHPVIHQLFICCIPIRAAFITHPLEVIVLLIGFVTLPLNYSSSPTTYRVSSTMLDDTDLDDTMSIVLQKLHDNYWKNRKPVDYNEHKDTSFKTLPSDLKPSQDSE